MKFSFSLYRYACKQASGMSNVNNVIDPSTCELLAFLTFLTPPGHVHTHRVKRRHPGALRLNAGGHHRGAQLSDCVTARTARGSSRERSRKGNSRRAPELASHLSKGVKCHG